MKMVSYWKDENGNSPEPFYNEDGELFLIYGYYDHKNQSGGKVAKNKCIGMFWRDDYPSAHGYLAPCVIPERTSKCLLKGLFAELSALGDKDGADKVSRAICFISGID